MDICLKCDGRDSFRQQDDGYGGIANVCQVCGAEDDQCLTLIAQDANECEPDGAA